MKLGPDERDSYQLYRQTAGSEVDAIEGRAIGEVEQDEERTPQRELHQSETPR